MKITRKQLRQIIQEEIGALVPPMPRMRGQNERDGYTSGLQEEDDPFADFDSQFADMERDFGNMGTLMSQGPGEGRPKFSDKAIKMFGLNSDMDIDPLYSRLKKGKEDQVDALVNAMNQAVTDFGSIEKFPTKDIQVGSQVRHTIGTKRWEGDLGDAGAPAWVRGHYAVWEPGKTGKMYIVPPPPSALKDLGLKMSWKTWFREYLDSLIAKKIRSL